MTLDYRELSPAPRLSSVVECFWTMDVTRNTHHRVLPDGCADIIFFFHDGVLTQASAVGVMTRPHDANLSAGQRLLGIRFRPAMAIRVLPTPLDQWSDRVLPLRQVMGPAADHLLKSLPRVAPVEQQIHAIERSLEPSAASSHQVLSDRQLRRRSLRDAGLSPHRLAAILRFRAAVGQLDTGQRNLAQLAIDTGFCDQSHMTRAFQQFAATTPAAYLKQRCSLTSA